MVGIKPEDRDMLRSLWFEDPFAIKPEIVEYRFNRLVFGLRPSPSILGTTIAHHLRLYKQSEPEMAELLEKSLYVDDLITGEEDNESALAVYKKSKQIMSQGGFNLRKWNSNSHDLLKAIEDCEGQQSRPHESNRSKQVATTEDSESYATPPPPPPSYFCSRPTFRADKAPKTQFFALYSRETLATQATLTVACVASLSVRFGSKELQGDNWSD